MLSTLMMLGWHDVPDETPLPSVWPCGCVNIETAAYGEAFIALGGCEVTVNTHQPHWKRQIGLSYFPGGASR
jgi:hypothetical protein